MKHRDHTGIVPPQFTGKEIETEATIKLKDEADAKIFFDTAKKRLFDINNWNKITGSVTAQFQIIDEKGKAVTREVKKGD